MPTRTGDPQRMPERADAALFPQVRDLASLLGGHDFEADPELGGVGRQRRRRPAVAALSRPPV
jgi:hypothetical protein